MAQASTTVRRTLQFKFTLATGDASQLATMVKAGWPFIAAFGGKRVRLLQNVDDPKRIVQEIEYETHEAIELNRQKMASDPRVQAYLQTWRMMLGGAVDVDVYEEIGSEQAR
jgi:hypothetical protein